MNAAGDYVYIKQVHLCLAIAAALLGILLLVCPVSAEITNLTQLYPDMAPEVVTWENAGPDWQPSVNNSAMIWADYYDMVPPVDLSFTLTMNNGEQITGGIESHAATGLFGIPLPYQDEITTTLGSISSTAQFNHLPFIGVAPRYALTYGAAPTGEVYLVFLEQGRTGGQPYASNGILVDLAVDPNVQVNPPEINPAIRLETTSTNMFKVWGYSLTPEQLRHSKKTYTDIISVMWTTWDVTWGLLGQFIAFLIGFVMPNLVLLLGVGEGLLALLMLRKTGNVVSAAGGFIDVNLLLFDKISTFLSRAVTGLYEFIEAVFHWLG
jgi:hypothetical protein